MSARYEPAVTARKSERSKENVVTPGGSPMVLFTQAALSVGSSTIPIDAYSMYLIQENKDWTLILNKNVIVGSPYDERQDVLRAPMEKGEVSPPEKHFRVEFAHVAPRQCNMRIYFGKVGAWVEFREK